MLNHEVKTVREDEHTFTLDQDEIAGMVRGVALRALKVAGDDPNVIVGTPNIQVIGGSVAAVLKVVIKVADVVPDVSTPSTDQPDVSKDGGSVDTSAEKAASAPVVADSAPAVVAPPGFVPGFGKAA